MAASDPIDPLLLAEEAVRLRKARALGRSPRTIRLFEYLLERSLEGAAPKESEVAASVFGKEEGFNALEDASVRVYAYRLRRKLEDYYAANPGLALQLQIPRGEYRLELLPRNGETAEAMVEPEAAEGSASDGPDSGSPLPSGFRITPIWLAAAAAIFLLGILTGALLLGRERPEAGGSAARVAPWSTLAASSSPTVLVLGDYYIFGEANEKGSLGRLLRDFSIDSREDLDAFLMYNPDYIRRYVNLDLHYLPTGSGRALANILPLVPPPADDPTIVESSELPASALKTSNVVYIGYLSGLRILREPVFDNSHFAIGESSDELIDRRTNKTYVSDWIRVLHGQTPRRDYAYLAVLPRSDGRQLIVIAGTHDAALTQAAEIVSSAQELKRIEKVVGGSRGYEALYEVSAIGSTNFSSKLVAAYPVPDAR